MRSLPEVPQSRCRSFAADRSAPPSSLCESRASAPRFGRHGAPSFAPEPPDSRAGSRAPRAARTAAVRAECKPHPAAACESHRPSPARRPRRRSGYAASPSGPGRMWPPRGRARASAKGRSRRHPAGIRESRGIRRRTALRHSPPRARQRADSPTKPRLRWPSSE